MAIPIRLQVFEGPMDLLMHLIEKNKIDIYDIPIATITDQYLDYVRQMEHEDMNVTSEFLVMAATLLDIKSRMLLPKDEKEEEEEGDPRDELVQRLLEYKMFKYMSGELRDRSLQAGMSYYRQQDLPEEVRAYVPPVDYKELVGKRTALTLQSIFEDVMRRRKSRVDPVRSGFGEIHREEISAADKELFIRAYLENHPHADFRELLESQHSKEEVIVTFLVILELMKSQKIRITQEEAFGRITIDAVEKDAGEAQAEEPGQWSAESGEKSGGNDLPEPAEPDEVPAEIYEETAATEETEEIRTVGLSVPCEYCVTENAAVEQPEQEKRDSSRCPARIFHKRLALTNTNGLRRNAELTGIHREAAMTERCLGMRRTLAYKKAVQRLRSRRIWHRKRRIHGISTQ